MQKKPGTKPNLSGRNRPVDITKTEAQLIAECKGERSLRDAAAWFNEDMPQAFHRSHTSVADWINGDSKPDDSFIEMLKTWYAPEDPRYLLAVDILALRARAAVPA
jgi:hypothetical protein